MKPTGISLLNLLLAAALLSACAQNTPQIADNIDTAKEETPAYQPAANENFTRIGAATTAAGKDRAAILAMQGEYKVDFDFKETVVLQPGYQRRPPKHSERFEFVAEQTWALKPLAAGKRAGTWTQCVYEVSDAPRYCGTGTWNHRYGVSTWTSDRSWRPLPRREYTTRDDYNALNVENRHTVTAQGWTHEQDNTKTVRAGSATQETLVREFGFNNYRRIDGYDFSPAYRYWEKTAAYWADVRRAWSERFARGKGVVLKTAIDGMPIIEATFSHAASIEKGEQAPTREDVDEVLNRWVAAKLD